MLSFLRGVFGRGEREGGRMEIVAYSREIGSGGLTCDFSRLAKIINDAMDELVKGGVVHDEYADKFSMEGRCFKSRVEGGDESVSLIVDLPGIADNPAYRHIYADEGEGVVGPGVHYGILRLAGAELKAQKGNSTRTYTKDEVGQIITEAYKMVVQSYWPM